MRYMNFGLGLGAVLLLLVAFVQADPITNNENYFNPLDLKFESAYNAGYTSNLLTDSSDVEDVFSTTSARLKFYPLSSMELILYGDYTFYNDQYDLSNHSKGLTLTYIPTPKMSKLFVYLSGGFSGKIYEKKLNRFNKNNFNLITSIRYNLTRTFSVRTGIKLESNSYLNTDASDNDSYDIFTGINFSFLGSNSIDIEGGYSFMNLSYIPDTTGTLYADSSNSYDAFHIEGDLNSYYISPRFSRPLGSKTGFNFTFHHKEFLNAKDAVILASAVNFISPWGNISEGQSYTASIKTVIIPDFIISTGFGYWKKRFLKTMIFPEAYAVRFAQRRHDEQNRFFLTIERPIYLKSGGALKPKLQIDLTHNNTTTRSMLNFYDYNAFSIYAVISYEL